jgi:hypothetical protein
MFFWGDRGVLDCVRFMSLLSARRCSGCSGWRAASPISSSDSCAPSRSPAANARGPLIRARLAGDQGAVDVM